MTQKRFYILILSLVLAVFTFAQSDENFLKHIHELESANAVPELKKLNDAFEKQLRSAQKEWQSYYYVALTNILIAFESKETDIKTSCDKAESYIKKADSLSANNSELMVLRSMLSAAMISSDQKKNAMKYGMQSNKYADKAIQLDPENPRAYLLKAKAQLHVPASLGGGTKSALSYYEKALEKFKTFKPKSKTDPNWGYAMAQKEYKEYQSKQTTDNGK